MKDRVSADQRVDVLYVHLFSGHYDYSIIPTGIIALMNSLSCSKRGMFWFEVKKSHIKNAKIIAIDLHWFYSLYPAFKMCRKYKKINPCVKIILGGYTATLFSDILVDSFDCDFIIKGDCEYSFPLLVERILRNSPCRDVPNLVTKDYATAHSYSLNKADFNASNYTETDWFPSLQRAQSRYSRVTSVYIQAIKGCFSDCPGCYGNTQMQELLCKRGLISRDPERICADIDYYERQGRIKSIYIDSDFINVFPVSEVEKMFNRRYSLGLHYRCYSFNGEEKILRALSQGFKFVMLYMPAYRIRGAVKENISNDELDAFLAKVETYTNITLAIVTNNVDMPKEKKEYLKNRMRHKKNILLRSDFDFIVPVPLSAQDGEFKKYFRISRLHYFNPVFGLLCFMFKHRENKMISLLLFKLYFMIQKKISLGHRFDSLYKAALDRT
jgi:hypothetical protein